jgi:hypothetical protein
VAANVTHKVVDGDTIWDIAVRYGVTEKQIMDLNGLKYSYNNNDERIVLITPGQELIIVGSAPTTKPNTQSRPTITSFGRQADSKDTLFAIWKWDKENTEKYQVRWKYQTSDDKWFYGTNTTITVDENDPNASKYSIYTIPNNAVAVSFEVLPIAKKKNGGANGSDSAEWTASWSSKKIYYCYENVIPTPSAPSVQIEKYKLTASVDNIPSEVKKVSFQIIRDNTTIVSTAQVYVVQGYASHVYTITLGSVYKVRCSYGGEWSPYSSNADTIPSSPGTITECKANSKSTDNRISIYLAWPAVSSASTYDIEYTTTKESFDGSDDTNTITGIETNHYETYSLSPGYEYFFRVRAVNNSGSSEWSAISSVVIGKKPTAPTTWSSSNSVIVGEPLNLYWVHNSEDGSSQTWAQLEVYANGTLVIFKDIKNTTDVNERDKTSVYTIDTNEYDEGVEILWRVRTSGVTEELGDWSIQRTVNIYAPPTLELNVTDATGDVVDILKSLPINISALAGPKTQKPIGYYLTITANDYYETVDNVGNTKMVNKGEHVYSKYFDISSNLEVELSAGDISLEINQVYTIACTAAMDSGLTAVSTPLTVMVDWEHAIEYEPNAEIGIDSNAYTAFIRPYCESSDGTPLEGILLSVYRREIDGRFVEIATGIDNSSGTFVTDPHPALDYARYRIVATDASSGAVRYYDMPGYAVGGKSVIIQWDENWLERFDSSTMDILVEPTWSGSMLKLPYNIDISNRHKVDVSLVEYVGRQHPVSYYGTQLGESATWNVTVAKNDVETLYALRRLSIWMNDVYVREPSGSGYWAHISVSYNQKHRDVIIPVTIEVTRVEGGM